MLSGNIPQQINGPEEMDYLLLKHQDPALRANAFSILFDEAPTYQEIDWGTHDLAYFIKLNEVFVRNKVKPAEAV